MIHIFKDDIMVMNNDKILVDALYEMTEKEIMVKKGTCDHCQHKDRRFSIQ